MFRRLLKSRSLAVFSTLLTAPIITNSWSNPIFAELRVKPSEMVNLQAPSLAITKDGMIKRQLKRLALFISVFFRFIAIGVLFTPILFSFPVWYYFDLHRSEEDGLLYPKRTWWVYYVVWSLEMAGPSWVKLGQWASSRHDIFPEYVCTILSKLQSNVNPHSFHYTRNVLEKQFGRNWEDIFTEFNKTPIGVGAVAQVYKAKMNTMDHPVAIKILHPNAVFLTTLDLMVMHSVAKFLEFVVPEARWLSLPEEVEVFASMMHQQLDLNLEREKMDLFIHNFRDWPSVAFPATFEEYSSKEVLVESYIEALSMNLFLRMSSCFDKKIAMIGMTTFMKMLLLDNHLHADLHPSNMLVSFKSNKDGHFISQEKLSELSEINSQELWDAEMRTLENQGFTPFVYFIDAGLTTSLSPEHLTNFIDLFKAITEFNGHLISDLMVERSKTPGTVVDKEGFARKMEKFMSKIRESTLSLGKVSVTDILEFVFTTVRRHHVKIDAEYANIGIAIMLIEGMGKKLEPDMDLLKASLPFLAKAIRNRLYGNISAAEKGFFRYWREYLSLLYASVFY
jgi:aarF domain-containing kinase